MRTLSIATTLLLAFVFGMANVRPDPSLQRTSGLRLGADELKIRSAAGE